MMFKLASNLYRAVKGGVYCNRALELASKGKYEAALNAVVRIEEIGPLLAEFALLKGFLLYAVNRDDEAVRSLIEAQKLVEASQKYSDDDKEYLKCYASVWGGEAAKKLGGKVLKPFFVDFGKVSLSKVKKHLKRKFPLRDHPNWVET